MALVIPENHVQAAMPLRYGGTEPYAYVTLGLWDYDSSLTIQETIDVFATAFVNGIGPILDGGINIGPAIGTVEIGGGNYATVEGTVTGVGGREDEESTSPAVAVVIRKSTTRPGRTGRGRMFLPWVTLNSEVAEDGSLETVTVSAIQSAFNDFTDEMNGDGVTGVILHNTGVPGGTTPTLITGYTVEPRVGTIRRRQRR